MCFFRGQTCSPKLLLCCDYSSLSVFCYSALFPTRLQSYFPKMPRIVWQRHDRTESDPQRENRNLNMLLSRPRKISVCTFYTPISPPSKIDRQYLSSSKSNPNKHLHLKKINNKNMTKYVFIIFSEYSMMGVGLVRFRTWLFVGLSKLAICQMCFVREKSTSSLVRTRFFLPFHLWQRR